MFPREGCGSEVTTKRRSEPMGGGAENFEDMPFLHKVTPGRQFRGAHACGLRKAAAEVFMVGG